MKMIKTATIIIILLTAVSLYAEEGSVLPSAFPFDDGKSGQNDTQTLFGSDEFHVSGFGGLYSSTSRINGYNATFMGGRGAAIINDTFIIGGGGCGLVYPISRSDLGNDVSEQNAGKVKNIINMGYGGILVGVHIFQKSILNLSLTSIIGGGEFYFTDSLENDESTEVVNEFFVMEPTLMMHLNLTKWMRIGAGVSYRYTRGLDTDEFTDRDFSKPSVVAAIDFGWF